jgi:adenine phosphoribosyltransferase
MIEQKLRLVVRDIHDFPKPGIVFKDITPILQDPLLCREVVDGFIDRLKGIELDVVVGVESRGFFFGMMLAERLNLPFVPIRKPGKLPYTTIQQSYDLEYGSSTIEIHEDAFPKGARILLHDDLLATGGTIIAANKLIECMGGNVSAMAFVISLDFLEAKDRLREYSDNIISLISF